MRWWHFIYMPEDVAVQLGLTHNARLFGVPAWVREEPEAIVACPKFTPMTLYFRLADAVLWTVAFLTALEIETPLVLLHPIPRKDSFDA